MQSSWRIDGYSKAINANIVHGYVRYNKLHARIK